MIKLIMISSKKLIKPSLYNVFVRRYQRKEKSIIWMHLSEISQEPKQAV